MANQQFPLLFFRPVRTMPDTDACKVASALLAGTSPTDVSSLDPARVLQTLKATRGFARLTISLPVFRLDNPRLQAALEGTARESHIDVRFYGDFNTLAESLFRAFGAMGLVCYSVWDEKLVAKWPTWEELKPDKGFAARMLRIEQRETMRLREIEPDPKRRAKLLDAFVQSPEFRAEMAREARLEVSGQRRNTNTYSDYANCFIRWKKDHPSAQELLAARKLDPHLAAASIAELRKLIGNSPRLLVLTAGSPKRVAALRAAAARYGLALDVELPGGATTQSQIRR